MSVAFLGLNHSYLFSRLALVTMLCFEYSDSMELMGTSAESVKLDQTAQNAVSGQVLHCLLT